MNQLFFLSHAAERSNKYLEKFYRDLSETITDLAPSLSSTDGFLDTNDIKVGAEWEITLATVLNRCQAFIPLYSPEYFRKEACGKEWRIFSSRQSAYVAGLPPSANRPSLIMPVLWSSEEDLKGLLPDVVSKVQYKDEDLGKLYLTYGLKQLMMNNKYRSHYRTFLVRFAKKLIQATSQHELPPLSTVEPFHKVKSVFHEPDSNSQGTAGSSDTYGSRESRFVFVAGSREELKAVRQKVEQYGEEGGYDWQPFSPDFQDEVGIIAQEVAAREKFHYRFVQFDDKILEHLNDAELRNRIVAIVIDSWTLCLPRYSSFLSEYDRRNFVNCAALVLWNSKDDETETNRPILINRMWGTLSNHAVKPDACFRESITSPDELKAELGCALNRARARTSAKAAVVKKAQSDQSFEKPPTITGVRRASA